MRPITKEMLNRNLDKLIHKLSEFVTTVQWWNTHRTDAEPMDCEDIQILLKLAKEARAQPDMIKREAITNKMAEYVKGPTNAK